MNDETNNKEKEREINLQNSFLEITSLIKDPSKNILGTNFIDN